MIINHDELYIKTRLNKITKISMYISFFILFENNKPIILTNQGGKTDLMQSKIIKNINLCTAQEHLRFFRQQQTSFLYQLNDGFEERQTQYEAEKSSSWVPRPRSEHATHQEFEHPPSTFWKGLEQPPRSCKSGRIITIISSTCLTQTTCLITYIDLEKEDWQTSSIHTSLRFLFGHSVEK